MFFFISGVDTKSKDLGNVPNAICPSCGTYTCMRVSVIYSSFSVFFVPLISFNRRYLVTSPCCGAVYSLDRDEGEKFEKGLIDSIDESKIHRTSSYSPFPGVCPNCGEKLPYGAKFCSQCGKPLNQKQLPE